MSEFVPKSFLCLKNYTKGMFRKDLLAGVTVGIISLPLAMAFAIAAGVGPEKGLFTAIIAGFLISALGGSRVQIGGPTGAFVVLIYSIIERSGYEGLCTATLLASVFLVLFGLCRLGSWIKYVPHPLITGFTTGLAVLIFSTQIHSFFGLQIDHVPASFAAKWIAYFKAFPTAQLPAFGVGFGTLSLILAFRRWAPSIPWGISALVLTTLASYALDLPIATIQTQFGAIPSSLPSPTLPSLSLSWEKLPEILSDAIAIAFLGGIESLLSAVIGDRMSGGRHKSNCELVAQGVANFGSILFGGIPATGAIARTAANVRIGAQTPVSGMLHAVTLFFIILFLGPVVGHIPLAALAAVLVVVAWNMSEIDHFLHLFKAPSSDVAILLTAFFLTLFVDITAAIFLGMVLATFAFMKKMADSSKTVQGQHPSNDIHIYEVHGPLFFGASDLFKEMVSKAPKVLILRLHRVPLVDASGMNALRDFFSKCKKENTALILSDVAISTEKGLQRFGLKNLIGEENVLPDKETALLRAENLIKSLDKKEA